MSEDFDVDSDVIVEWICNSECAECTAMEGEYTAETLPDRPHQYCECSQTFMEEEISVGDYEYADEECYRIEVTSIAMSHGEDTVTFFMEYEIICKQNGKDVYGESLMEEEDFGLEMWHDFDELYAWSCDKLSDVESDAKSKCGTECRPYLT